MGVLLDAKSLKKTLYRFKNFKWETNMSVKDVSLYVNEGEIVGILGPNGAGKSTSLKMITGDYKPDKGSVFFNGEDITDWPMYKRSRVGLGYMAQENTLFNQMTVENNLVGIMQMQGLSQQECRNRCEELMDLFDLDRIRNNLAGNISGGEKRRLEVARALTRRPKMLILDEPFAGVDPKVTQSILDLVLDLWWNWKIAILITDHNYRRIVQIVERCYVIFDGKVAFEGGVEDMVNDPFVQKIYLGDDEQEIITVDEFGRKRVNSRLDGYRNRSRSFSQTSTLDQTSVSDQEVQVSSSVSAFSQSEQVSEEWQNVQSAETSVMEQYVSEDNSELTEQSSLTTDADLSELLPPVQADDNSVNSAPSPTLADFIQKTEAQADEILSQPFQNQTPKSQFEESDAPFEEPTSQTNPPRQRKTPLSGPTIKPFRRKK